MRPTIQNPPTVLNPLMFSVKGFALCRYWNLQSQTFILEISLFCENWKYHFRVLWSVSVLRCCILKTRFVLKKITLKMVSILTTGCLAGQGMGLQGMGLRRHTLLFPAGGQRAVAVLLCCMARDWGARRASAVPLLGHASPATLPAYTTYLTTRGFPLWTKYYVRTEYYVRRLKHPESLLRLFIDGVSLLHEEGNCRLCASFPISMHHCVILVEKLKFLHIFMVYEK